MGQNGTGPRGPRCIALVGPFQSGKTTLLEAILTRTGAVARQGTVDAGTSVGDASKEARLHKMSVEATFATANFMGDSPVASAFKFAFQVPSLFRRLLGEGALSAAFIPIFKEKEKNNN